jgi:glycosyltransferase involved in cell wall biosynthesis
VWNEWILRKALRPNITGRLYRWAIKKADVVHCNWHGTANFVLENQLHSNVKVYYWGLHPDYFSNEEPKISPVTSTFLTTLEEDKTFFFFPKSISVNSRHDLVIEACKILSEKGIRDFRVIFWPGNTTNPEVLARLEQLISSYQLEHTVTIYHHDFVPFSDMKVIWNQMDCGLQIADNEQLSTTFTEPQFFKKEIIVTDIEPYRIYNEKFESKIPLISMDSDALALRMQEIIGGKKTESSLIKHRSAVIHKHFNIMKNIDRIVQIYEDQVNRFSKEDKVF